MRFPPNRLLALIATLAAAGLGTACGSDSAPEQAAPPPPEAPAEAPPADAEPPATETAQPPATETEASGGAAAELEREQTFTAEDGTEIPFTLVLPPGFEPGEEYPVLLALPPGGQGPGEVDAGLGRYWEDEALARGWVVVSPVAPGGELYFEGAEVYVPELLDHVATLVRPEGGRFHLAGVSNGGLSAYKVATESRPELFASLLALPGHPPDQRSEERLDHLVGTRVWMLVGSEDDVWRESAEATRERLRELRVDATLTVLEGQEHILDVDPALLYDFLDSARPQAGS